MKDISPKLSIKSADQELAREYVVGSRPLGESIGGLQMFFNSFKRGYGDKVFGLSEEGIWLGAADYENGKFKVSMAGDAEMQSASFKDENNETFIDAKGLVSTANFSFETISIDNCNLAGQGANFVQIPGASMDITLSRQSRVLVMFSGYFSEYDDFEWGYSIYAALFVNDVYHSTIGSTPAQYSNDFVINAMKPVTLSAGTPNLKIKILTSAMATANLGEMTMGYLVLGK
jgi:hypothetical protein